MKKYKQHVESTLSNLLHSPVSFWGTDSYDVFFEDGQLDQLKIKTAFPDMCTTDENEANLPGHITTTVGQYFTLNLWEKLWWRLTKPISHYMMLNDILTLNQMKEAIAEDSASRSIVIYNQSSLSQHLDFWDSLMTSWRYLLDNFVLTKSTRYKDSLTRDSLIYIKEPFQATELITQFNQYVALTDQLFNRLGSIYIYCSKENMLKALQDEYNACEKILHKLNPANNLHIEIEVAQCTQTLTNIKKQLECRLNIICKEHTSLEAMVNELLSQDDLTSAERARLDSFQESIRDKQKLAASNAYYDKTIKEIQEQHKEIQEQHKEIQEQHKEIQEMAGQVNQSLQQLDQRIIQLQENDMKQEHSLKELKDNSSRQEQSLKELKDNSSRQEQSLKELDQDIERLQENDSKQEQSLKELYQDLRQQKDKFQAECQAQFVRFEGKIGQFFSQQADTNNGILIDQSEEESTDEETSYTDFRMS